MSYVKLLYKSGATFPYSLLSRLQIDCEYYLNFGQRYAGHLWAGNCSDQIHYMKILWSYLSKTSGAPEWIDYEEILDYEKKMMVPDILAQLINLNISFSIRHSNLYFPKTAKTIELVLALYPTMVLDDNKDFIDIGGINWHRNTLKKLKGQLFKNKYGELVFQR